MPILLPLLVVLTVLLAGSAVPAQTSPSPESPAPAVIDFAARADRLFTLALEGQAMAILTDLTTTAPSRLSGSPGAARAVAWAKQKMTEIGLSNVRLQPVRVPHWVRGDRERLVVHGAGEPFELPILALGGSVGTPPAGLTGEILMVRDFEQLAAPGVDATGRVVFFNRPMPRVLTNTFRAYGSAVPQRTHGAVEAAKAGAVAALVRSMTTAIDDHPHTGAMRYADDVGKIPAAAVSTAGAEKLASLLASGVKLRVELQLSCKSLDDVTSHNVIGEIPGREAPDQIVLIGGHLDAWDVGQGAHDDGAGCTHTLEAMRLILASGIRPRRTIRAVLFMNEENGLCGGRAYAEELGGQGHVAAIESDAGGFEPKGFSTTEQGARMEKLKEIAEHLRPFGPGAMIPGGGGADIGPLRAHGVPLYGMVITSHRYFDHHHSARDIIDAVNERELALGAAALAYMASCLADVDLP